MQRLPYVCLAAFAAIAAALLPAPGNAAPWMEEGAGTLAPFPFARFCAAHPAECSGAPAAAVDLTPDRLAQLREVNRTVNAAIAPRRRPTNPVLATWAIAPGSGDCNDYAVTKRHALIAMGWPSGAVVLAVVVTPWGEGHLVAVARTSGGDLVRDNLRGDILPWTVTRYMWIARQSSADPRRWVTVPRPAGSASARNGAAATIATAAAAPVGQRDPFPSASD